MREINYYKRIAPKDTFQWHDIATDPGPLKTEGISQSQALLLLHAKDGEGKMYVGVDAFIVIWQQLAYWKLLAGVASLPLIKPALDFVYARFARWRFDRLEHCQIALKHDRGKK